MLTVLSTVHEEAARLPKYSKYRRLLLNAIPKRIPVIQASTIPSPELIHNAPPFGTLRYTQSSKIPIKYKYQNGKLCAKRVSQTFAQPFF